MYRKNIQSNFLTQIFHIVTGFVTSVLIARALGPEGKGYLVFLTLIFNLIAQYSHFGVLNATTYYQKRSQYSVSEIFNTNMTYVFFLLVLITAGVFGGKYSGLIFAGYDFLLLILGLIFVLATLLFIIIRMTFIGREEIHEVNKMEFLSKGIYTLLIVLFFATHRLTVLVCFALFAGMAVLKCLSSYAKLGIAYHFSFDKFLIRQEYHFGKYIFFAALFGYLVYRADQVLIKGMLGDGELGIYSVAVVLAELIFLIPVSVTSALSGRLYNLKPAEEKNEFQIVARTFRFTFYVCVGLALIGVALSPLVPHVYGIEYARSASLVRILFAGVVFASLGKVTYPYFLTKGRPQIHLLTTLGTLIVNIVLNLLLIPKYKITGAAYATLISYFLYGLSYIIFLNRRENVPLSSLFVLTKEDRQMIKTLWQKQRNN